MVQQEGGKRFALLLATADSEFAKKTYGGYYNVFVSAFGDEGETWDLFRVIDGEFPKDEDLEKYDGFVISGSSSDAFLDDDWILKLCDLCKTLDSMKKKVLGICFGHQILCRIKGGKVGRAPRGPDLGLMKLNVDKDMASKYKYFGDKIPTSLNIISCHQDEILEMPEGADIIASSEKYNVEMFSMEDHLFGIQGHPEYTKEILFEIIDRLLGFNAINKAFEENSKATMANNVADRKSWETLCKNFLKGRQESII